MESVRRAVAWCRAREWPDSDSESGSNGGVQEHAFRNYFAFFFAVFFAVVFFAGAFFAAVFFAVFLAAISSPLS